MRSKRWICLRTATEAAIDRSTDDILDDGSWSHVRHSEAVQTLPASLTGATHVENNRNLPFCRTASEAGVIIRGFQDYEGGGQQPEFYQLEVPPKLHAVVKDRFECGEREAS